MPRQALVGARPAPATGPFSHAVQGGAPDQVRPLFRNPRTLLEELGLDFGDVVKVSVVLTDMADVPVVHDVYGEPFGALQPPRKTVAARERPMRALVEIDLVALWYLLAALPAVFFIRRPGGPFRCVVASGVVHGVIHLGMLIFGLAAGVSAGMRALALQLQVFCTALLGMPLWRERIRPQRWRAC